MQLCPSKSCAQKFDNTVRSFTIWCYLLRCTRHAPSCVPRLCLYHLSQLNKGFPLYAPLLLHTLSSRWTEWNPPSLPGGMPSSKLPYHAKQGSEIYEIPSNIIIQECNPLTTIPYSVSASLLSRKKSKAMRFWELTKGRFFISQVVRRSGSGVASRCKFVLVLLSPSAHTALI